MTFELPQALLLLLPLVLWTWRSGRVSGPAFWLRFVLGGVLVLALAQPSVSWRGAGADLVVVVDRSRSMPPGSQARSDELIRLIEAKRRPGDRIAVVSFGREARVEAAFGASSTFGGFVHPVDGEASDLAAALETAGELISPDRDGRVLVLSDGKHTGADPRGAARRLAARAIAVDFRWLGRTEGGVDLAVAALELPASVAVREPFQLTAVVHATEEVSANLVLERDGRALVKGSKKLHRGENLLTFRDLLERPGLATYQLRVEAAGDAVAENDVGRGVVRVEGPPRVLVINESGRRSAHAAALEEAGVAVEVRAPFPLAMDALDGVGAVVLENVEAGRLSESGLRTLAQYVKEAGGGLVMTGGQRSFGAGGYRKSPLEELLPVSLELREEQRKAAVAMSIIMDCSCSMGATVPDGRTKMEVAAEGVVGALELLDLRDEASVHMVDTEPHEIFSLQPVSEGLPLDRVARGFSGGGGIFVGVGLRTARDEILRSDKSTRHVLLFSDAADSENPDDYLDTLAELSRKHVTVSVIGLGRPEDVDADLLRDIASRGGGRIYFAEDALSLPRIFSQETIAVARSTFVDQPRPVVVGPDLALLGRVATGPVPDVGGYNVTYLKPQASVGLRSADEERAPIVAFWPKGSGRVTAYTGEVDGVFTGPIRDWGGFRGLLVQMVRWAMPASPERPDRVVRAVRRGNDLHVTLDFDPDAPPPEETPVVYVLAGDARTDPVEIPMRWEDGDRMGAHFTLPGSGIFHPVVKLGSQVWRAAPVTLPYAPEFEPARAGAGRATLAALARDSGGVERLSVEGLWEETVQSAGAVPLAPALVAGSLVLLLAEVVTRRFFAGVRRRPRPAQAREPERSAAPASVPAPVHVPEPSSSGVGEPADGSPRSGVQSALEAARGRARKRLRR